MDQFPNEEEDNFFFSDLLNDKLDLSEYGVNEPPIELSVRIKLQDKELFGTLQEITSQETISYISISFPKENFADLLINKIEAITIQQDDNHVFSYNISNNITKEIKNLGKDTILLNLKTS